MKDKNNVVSNGQIRYPEVRVLGEDKSEIGIMSSKEAIIKATNSGLDLVLITDKANPPVCRIVSLNKYQYELKKMEKEREKKNRKSRVVVKEITFRPTTGEHDLNTKINQINKFIAHGDKVKLSVRFRGREMTHQERGRELLITVINSVSNCVQSEPISFSGSRMSTLISPEK